MTSVPAETPAKLNRREVFAWAMYDWANSAYSTLSITILVFYIKEVVVPGRLGTVVWAWGISLSMLTAAVLSPILGAMADANAGKRRWLAVTALSGAGCAVLLAFVPPQSAWLVISLFVVTCLMFELSLGFYNGFLPEIAGEKDLNRVSAWGYALGYLGGALALLLALGVKIFGESLGLPEVSDQLRAGILIMGLWWGLFTLPTIWILRDRGIAPENKLPPIKAISQAIGEVGHTLRNIRLYKTLSLFLLAFLFYNDGIQSVISQSSTFAIDVLSFSVGELIILILVIQLVALPGALLVGRLADWIGQKPTLVGCLAVWIALIIAAYHITSKPQFWVLGVVLAFVMGGTQSISRAIMGLMTPVSRSAEFFGFFNFSGKATSFLGTFLFGLIIAQTGDPRLAILSLLVFFLVGWGIVASINIQKGRREAIESQ